MEMFATLTIAPKTGSTKHLSTRRHTSLPVLTTTFLLSSNGKLPSWCQTTRVCCRFVKHFSAIILALEDLEGSAVALLELPLVSKVVLAFQWQFVHFCNIICSFPCSTIKTIITVWSLLTVWTLIKRFYGLLGPKLATPGGDKFPLPSQVYRLLGTKVDLTVSPREIQVLPSRVDSNCCELKQILSSKKLSKGHASEIFGKLSFSPGQLFGRFGRMYLAAFKLRQYGRNGCSHLTAEIERAIAFWLFTPLVPTRPTTFCTPRVV